MTAGYYELNGRRIPHDPEGFIENLEDWSPALAEVIAKNDGIELTDAHWEVINLVRNYYDTFGIAPNIHVLTKHMKKVLGPEKGKRAWLEQLFPGPGSPAARLAKIAGLPKPTGCV